MPSVYSCPACGGKVSEAATACPHCGHPLMKAEGQPENAAGVRSKSGKAGKKKMEFWRTTLGAIGSLIIIGFMTGIIGGDPDGEAIPAATDLGSEAASSGPQNTTAVPQRTGGGHKIGKQNQIGCVSKNDLDEVNMAAMNQDREQFYRLFTDQRCFILEGHEFSVVDTDWGKARIRVYEGDGSVILWTPIETTM